MAVDGSVSCNTSQVSRHPESLNSMHFFEGKKKIAKFLLNIQNDSINLQNDSKILYLLSEENIIE